MYPSVTQFETRRRVLEEELGLAWARRANRPARAWSRRGAAFRVRFRSVEPTPGTPEGPATGQATHTARTLLDEIPQWQRRRFRNAFVIVPEP